MAKRAQAILTALVGYLYLWTTKRLYDALKRARGLCRIIPKTGTEIYTIPQGQTM